MVKPSHYAIITDQMQKPLALKEPKMNKRLSKKPFVTLREALCALRGKILKALTTKYHKGKHEGAPR